MPSSGSREGASAEKLDALVRDAGFYRSLVEHSSDAIVTIDERSTILYANASVERVLGYDPDSLIGESLTVLMPVRFHETHLDSVDSYLKTGERQMDWTGVELPAEHADGHEVPLSITFEEHLVEGTRMFSGIMRDISDRVEREDHLEQRNERLEQFARMVSHDLREPLQTARATATIARTGDDEAYDELFAVFDRMEELVDDVLELAKQGQTVGDRAAVDLAAVANDAWKTAGTDGATLEIDENLPTLSADPERLRTLLENLFRNAVEHGSTSHADNASTDDVEHDSTSPDSQVRQDTVEHGGRDVTVRVGATGEGFFVADDGPGFGETPPERLFEAGYTTSSDGTGFGLRIVEEIAAAHEWAVSATRADSGGARFEVVTNE